MTLYEELTLLAWGYSYELKFWEIGKKRKVRKLIKNLAKKIVIATEKNQPIKIWDKGIDIIISRDGTVMMDNIRYGYELFKAFGDAGLDLGVPFKLVERKDGAITIQELKTITFGNN